MFDKTLTSIINYGQKHRDEIIKEHNILYDYAYNHIEDYMNMLQEKGGGFAELNEKDVKELIKFDDDILLDSFLKIWRQIRDYEKEFDSTSVKAQVQYYIIIPNLYKEQKDNGFELGELDDKGQPVTGSNIATQYIFIDKNNFKDFYKTVFN